VLELRFGREYETGREEVRKARTQGRGRGTIIANRCPRVIKKAAAF